MPRGRGGRGRGRGGRYSKPAAPLLRKSTRTASNLSESNLSNLDGQAGVYATWDPVARLLTIHGLTDEDFERWDQDDENEVDSVINEDPASPDQPVMEEDLDEEYLREPPPKPVLSQYEELWISPPRRGFYAPPPVKVWRKKSKTDTGNGEEDGVLEDDGDPLIDRDSVIDEDQGEASDSNPREQVSGPDIVVSAEGASKDVEMEEVVEEEARSEAEDEPTEMVDEGELSDSELPPPFLDRPPTPDEADCDDAADFIVRTRFAPMSDPQAFIKALTKFPVPSRNTKLLYELAVNTQRALKEWQDEYLKLDARTAPHSNPPKKAVTGGRHPIDPAIYEDMKEADLYGYNFDPKRGPGLQDPFRQRPGGSESVGGRELRQRRARELGEEPSDDEGTGTEVGKRKRKAVVRYDGEPRAMRGRKRALDSEPPEADGPPRKRGRPSAADRAAMQMHMNIRRLREESTIASTISESESISPGPPRRRGRPPGSKNLQPRSDAGIKKGPRKVKLARSLEPEAMQTEDDLAPTPSNGGELSMSNSGILEDPFVNNSRQAKSLPEDEALPSGGASTPATDVASQGPVNKRKQRVKSEKRSESMTLWWAARKAKQLEERKKQQAELEQQRLAEQQQAERNNFHNRFWTNEANPSLSQKVIRTSGPAIAPAPHQSSHSSPITSQFIISGPQQKPGHERKRSSPLKHEHMRTLSKDMKEIPPPHPYSPPAPRTYPPPPPMAIPPVQQPATNPFGPQLSPLASLPSYRPTPVPNLPPPPPHSYPPPNQTSPIAAQGPSMPQTHPTWPHLSYPPPPPGYQPQPPYIPPPQSSSHPPTLAPAAPLPPLSYPPHHGAQLQPLQPAPPAMGQHSPPGPASRGPPDHWMQPREWPRVPSLEARPPQLGPPAPIYEPKQEELRRQEQRLPHELVHSHGESRERE